MHLKWKQFVDVFVVGYFETRNRLKKLPVFLSKHLLEQKPSMV
ncbi:WSSV392 [White spot syndrome virus]|uniref:WSSV392 n=1 Tax=White spot syndrome virus TaxID=342409 RepID=A0A2I6SC88_9VIRU|nr:WSSV392 [White spot syndrome virus]